MAPVTLCLLVVALAGAAAEATSFISIGDWGGHALDNPEYKQTSMAVAGLLKSVAHNTSATLVINTGDNFYWCGLQNVSDYQIKVDWLDPYSGVELPWFSVLGNHEYGYNVSAQIAMGKVYPNWILDSRYYTRRVVVSTGVSVSMIFLDTSPCVAEYRSSNPSGWDPCGTEYPTCSIKNPADPHDQFEGPCHFHENILTQDCPTQLAWFKKALAAVPADDWLVVVGHHPIDELDVEDFVQPLTDHGFDLYLNGHAHTLSQYTIDGGGAYVTTGAGAMLPTEDQMPTTAGKRRTHSKVHGAPVPPSVHAHKYHTVWNMAVPGLTLHTFSADFRELTTTYVKYTGEVLHSFTTTKGSGPAPSPPSPSPPSPPSPPPSPGPPPTGKCCHYYDTGCGSGDVCCKSHCDNPSTCSYTEEGCHTTYAQDHHCKWTGTLCVVP